MHLLIRLSKKSSDLLIELSKQDSSLAFWFLILKLTLTQQNTRGCSVWGSLGGISADVQSCGATAISKYAAMMSWVS